MSYYKIAVCDDDEEMLLNISKYVEKELISINCEYDISNFNDIKKMLLNNHDNNFDIFFLDIDMPDINGLEAAHNIKLYNQDSVIIFVSGMDGMVYESLKLQPLRFIRKSEIKREISEAVKAAINHIEVKSYKTTVTLNNQEIKIDIKNIIYIESARNYIYVHAVNNKISKHIGSINQKEKELEEYGFIRTHVGYLVNQKYIRRINKNSITLINNQEVPVSRSKLKIVQQKFIEDI